jgi:hypothetical protein
VVTHHIAAARELFRQPIKVLAMKDAAAFGGVTFDVLVRVMTPQDCVSGTADTADALHAVLRRGTCDAEPHRAIL